MCSGCFSGGEYMGHSETRSVMSGGNFMGVINVLMQLRKVGHAVLACVWREGVFFGGVEACCVVWMRSATVGIVFKP